MTIYLRIGALLAAAALMGGGAALAVDTTQPQSRTIIRTASPAENVAAPATTGLSINSIYRCSALGGCGGDGHVDDQVGKPDPFLRAILCKPGVSRIVVGQVLQVASDGIKAKTSAR